MNEARPAEVFPPGEFLQEEMEARGWTQEDLARILDKPLPTVNRIINGKHAITPETAKRLGAAFGNSPQFWINLESAWQLHKTDEAEADEVRKRAAIYDSAPVREMARRGWIPNPKSPAQVKAVLCKHFGVNNLDEVPDLRAAARSSVRGEADEITPSQWAWICRARGISDRVDARKYSKSGLSDCIGELSRLTNELEEVRRVPRLLAEAGVRLVIVKNLKRTQLDGAALHRNSNEPVVALSLRFGRLDNFWFTLMHELSHVLNSDGVRADSDIYTQGQQVAVEENRANQDAASWLVPQDQLQSFINRTTPHYSTDRVSNFSRKIGVHPAIVVGQLKFRREIAWDHLHRFNTDIRKFIVESTISDGWGQITSSA